MSRNRKKDTFPDYWSDEPEKTAKDTTNVKDYWSDEPKDSAKGTAYTWDHRSSQPDNPAKDTSHAQVVQANEIKDTVYVPEYMMRRSDERRRPERRPEHRRPAYPGRSANPRRRTYHGEFRRRRPVPAPPYSSGYRYGGRNPAPDSSSVRTVNTAKAVFIVSLSALVLILSLVLGVSCYIQQNILNRITFEDSSLSADLGNLDLIEIEDDGDTNEGDVLSSEEASTLEQMIDGGLVSPENLYRADGVTNILLLGLDSRTKSTKGSRSDVMIILSVNENRRQIVMTSVMRDTCVNIPGRTALNKINAAHAFGGSPLSVKTVEQNFGVDIDRYVSINFYAFIDVVNALGGLELDISENERLVMNNYIEEINQYLGYGPDHGKLHQTGSNLLLTGKQVLGYVRNRYTGDGDFARTQRQRIVLEKLINKCRQADITTLLKVLESAASYMATDYSQSELLSLMYNMVDYLDYEIISSRLPIDNTWHFARLDGMSIVALDDIHANRKALLDTIYGQQAE